MGLSSSMIKPSKSPMKLTPKKKKKKKRAANKYTAKVRNINIGENQERKAHSVTDLKSRFENLINRLSSTSKEEFASSERRREKSSVGTEMYDS